MTPLLAFLSSVTVGRIDKLAALATSAGTIDWLAHVSGMQFTSKLLLQAPGGPSHSGIFGVGLFFFVFFVKAPSFEAREAHRY